MDEMKLVEDWLKGLIDWADLPVNVQEAVEEAMVAYVDEAGEDDAASETVEEPFTAEIVKGTREQPSDANLELLHKADNEHRFTLGPWYIPDRYDAHGEWTDADELQKSLWEYVKSGDRGIRLQHNKDIVAGEWLEAMSFPVPVTIGMTKDANSKQVEYPAGTVFLGVQWKPWAWELVKAGKIQGFSIGGAAARIDMSMPDAIAKASFAGDRSAAGRYAANQRWQGSPAQQRVSERVASAMGYAGMEMAARMNAARSRKLEREQRGEKMPTLIDRLKTYFSEEYTNPKPLYQVEAELYGNDAKRASPRRSRNTLALAMGKSVEELMAEMRVTARITDFKKAQGFGGNRSDAGRYAAQQRWKGHNKAQPAKATAPVKADVVTDDATEALNALREGKTVSLGSVEEVNTLIKEMNDFVQEAKKKGDKVKLNLCQVSVPGTNLFCGSSLKDDQGQPIPRDKMPQLAGKPKAGSPAADASKFPVDKDGEVNVGDAFVKYLQEKGVETREGQVPVAQLKASQSELKGKTVAFMMSPKGQKAVDLEEQSIFVSSDGYVIDGHHRWAAKVGLDARDGTLGGKKIKVRVINMPIKQVLVEANAFTSAMGIEPKSA
jgi:hypothetical protein